VDLGPEVEAEAVAEATLQLRRELLELTGVSSEEQRRLADAWLRRHASR
jgi:hypothetical protein